MAKGKRTAAQFFDDVETNGLESLIERLALTTIRCQKSCTQSKIVKRIYIVISCHILYNMGSVGGMSYLLTCLSLKANCRIVVGYHVSLTNLRIRS